MGIVLSLILFVPLSGWELSAVNVQSAAGLGSMQGVEVREERVYLYGDADTGIIREFDFVDDKVKPTQRALRLTVQGRDQIPHPTGLSHHPLHGTIIGNTSNGTGTIYWIDWDRAWKDGVLDSAIRHSVEDTAAVNGTRPEFVRWRDRWLVASSDYGRKGNEVRVYDPVALRSAKRTSEPGVLVAKFPCGPWVQSLHWIDAEGILLLIQNQIEGLKWRLTRVDLALSLETGSMVVVDVIDLAPTDELEGAHLVRPNRLMAVSSSPEKNLCVYALGRRIK